MVTKARDKHKGAPAKRKRDEQGHVTRTAWKAKVPATVLEERVAERDEVDESLAIVEDMDVPGEEAELGVEAVVTETVEVERGIVETGSNSRIGAPYPATHQGQHLAAKRERHEMELSVIRGLASVRQQISVESEVAVAIRLGRAASVAAQGQVALAMRAASEAVTSSQREIRAAQGWVGERPEISRQGAAALDRRAETELMRSRHAGP